MSDDDSPLPPSPPQSEGSTLPLILSILFVVFSAGVFIGFNMCAKNFESGGQAGLVIFIVSAFGLGITTIVAAIRLLIFIMKKFDKTPPQE